MDRAAELMDGIIAWYAPEEWDAWRAACEDGETFFAEDFASWEARARAAIEDQRRQGFRLHPCLIRLTDFLEWTREHGLPTNTQSRSSFAPIRAAMAPLET